MNVYTQLKELLEKNGINMNIATPLLDLVIANDVEEIDGVGTGAATNNVYTPEEGKVFQKFTVTGDPELIPANIQYGKTIFGVTGDFVPPVFSVDFNTDGGSEAPITQFIALNGLVIAPTEPTKEASVFAGWSADMGTTIWDFETDRVEGNTSLIAQWTAA